VNEQGKILKAMKLPVNNSGELEFKVGLGSLKFEFWVG